MYEELDIPEYLKVSNRVQVIASQITTKPVEQVVEEIMNEPVDLTVELKALAVSAYLNYLIWLKQQVKVNLQAFEHQEVVKPEVKQQVEVNLPSEVSKPVLMTWEGLKQPSVAVGELHKSNHPIAKANVESWTKKNGRGHHYAGKVWVLNRKTGERARIEPGEFSAYEVRGFIKAGPRTK